MQTEKMNEQKDLILQINIPQDLIHLIPGFLERRKQDISNLAQLFETKNFDELQKYGHRIKGHGAGYGFEKISEYGTEIEAYAKAEDESGLQSALAAYESYVRFVSENVNKIL